MKKTAPPSPLAAGSSYRETNLLGLAATAFALACLAAGSGAAQARRTVLMDETHRLRPGDWSFTDLKVDQAATLVQADFQVGAAGARVRLLLLRPPELERYRRERRASVLAATGVARAGKLAYLAREPGDYLLVVESPDSDRHPAADVRLRIELEPNRTARELPPGRKAAVVGLSLALFAACAFAAWRALRVLARARPWQP